MIQPRYSFNYGDKPYTPDLAPELEVRVETKEYPAFDAIEWVVYYKNNGTENTEILSAIRDADVVLPLPPYRLEFSGHRATPEAPKVIWMNGCVSGWDYSYCDENSAKEFSFHTDYLCHINEKRSYENEEGRGSAGKMPFFEIACKDHGYIAAIGWSGSWNATFTRCEEGIRMQAGLAHAAFYLMPGEEVRCASILVMGYTPEEPLDRYNKFRDLILNHYSMTVRGKDHPGVFSTFMWGGVRTEEMVYRIHRFREHGSVAEEIWLDAAWNGRHAKSDHPFETAWASEVGNWEINERIHPDRLHDVRDAIAEEGQGLVLWFDLARATPVTPIVAEHPEYFINIGDDYLLLNLGREDAWQYAYNLLCDRIEELNIRCYREDFNSPPAPFWAAADPEGREGITEIGFNLGTYRLWAALRERFPHLLIDNCASGGRRIDIETLKLSIPNFRSDYQCVFNPDPDVTSTHHANLSRYLPLHGCTTKLKMDDYGVRSTYTSSWATGCYSTGFQTMTDEEMDWLGGITQEYAAIRRFFYCHFYNHGATSLEKSAWMLWQYYDPKTDEGLIMAFRREESPNDTATIDLKECVGEYVFHNFDTGEDTTAEGRFTITLDKPYTSAIFTYKKA